MIKAGENQRKSNEDASLKEMDGKGEVWIMSFLTSSASPSFKFLYDEQSKWSVSNMWLLLEQSLVS